MANRQTRKRGAGIIALVTVIAALAGSPSAAFASPGKSHGKGNSSPPVAATTSAVVTPLATADGLCLSAASWAE